MSQLETKKKDLVNFFLKKGLLLSHDILTHLENEGVFMEIMDIVEKGKHKDIAVLNEKIRDLLNQPQSTKLNWSEIEKYSILSEKRGGLSSELFNALPVEDASLEETKGSNVKIVVSYENAPKKREAQDFIDYFNIRFSSIKKILKQRQEMQNSISLNRIFGKKEREHIAMIGMVRDKRQTKNGNYMLTIEDETSYIRVIVNKTKPSLFSLAKDIVLDEVIGVEGVNGENIIFANNIIFPDIPTSKEIKKSNDKAYMIFLSDLHVGSKYFLEEDFQRFLKWINNDLGNEAQRLIASKVKYIFILGDLVDGCGVYPDQEKDLKIKDIKDQYKECANLLDKIPKHIKVIICPGNHDAMRVAEPQFPIYKDFAEPLYNLVNVIMVSNPAVINIHSSKNFDGFDLLLYHGYSFDYYVAEVESIRNSGGYDRADLIMKFLLKKGILLRRTHPPYTRQIQA